MKLSFEKQIALGFTLALVIISSIGFISYQSIQKFIHAAGLVTHTHEIISSIGNLKKDLLNAETGSRGYWITGDEKFLEPYTKANYKIREGISIIRNLIAVKEVQKSLNKLEELIDLKLEDLETKNRLRKELGFEPVLHLVKQGSGNQLMEDIRIYHCDADF